MRLDLYLYESNLASSRSEAKRLIIAGAVKVNGRVVTKPSFEIVDAENDILIDSADTKYVSRGGLKLEGALAAFDVTCVEKSCLDVGASSGGFTDCLLSHGAARVIALDAGSGQLSDKIRNDPRVTVVENYNARFLKLADLAFAPDMAVMDVSFISATYIIGGIADCLSVGSDFICLIKPQFEVGKSAVGKKGIVKNPKDRINAVKNVITVAESFGFGCVGVAESAITGGDGNIEYVAAFKKGSENKILIELQR